MSTKRNTVAADLATGVFMLAVLALLGFFTIVISGGSVFTGGDRVRARVAFDQVGGLKDHDNVMYRGTKVGTVERVEIAPSNLIVVIDVDRGVTLRENCRITVRALSFLGGNQLVLEEGTGAVRDLATTLFRGETPTDWMSDLSNIARNLNEISSEGGIKRSVENLEATTRSARLVAERLERGEGTIGRLLSRDDAFYGNMTNAMADARTVAASLKTAVSNSCVVTERLKRGEGTIGRLMTDERLYDDLRAAVADFRKASASMDISDAKSEAKEVLASARRMLASLETVSARLRDGEGTVGRLMTDPKMYDELNGLIRDVRQIIDNYRDTTPISTFSSLATGAL